MNESLLISDTALWKRLKDIATRSNRPIDDVLTEAVAEYVERHADTTAANRLPAFVGMLSSETSDTSERAEAILAEEIAHYLEDEAQE